MMTEGKQFSVYDKQVNEQHPVEAIWSYLWLLWLLSFNVDISLCYWLVHCSTFSMCSVNNMVSGFFLFTGHETRADKRILVKCSAVELCHHLSLALVCRFGCLFLFTTYCAIKSCAGWGSRTISFSGMAFNTISVEKNHSTSQDKASYSQFTAAITTDMQKYSWFFHFQGL